jgi:hypothetical protein
MKIRFDFRLVIPAPSGFPAQLRLQTGQDAPAGAASDPNVGPGSISAASLVTGSEPGERYL